MEQIDPAQAQRVWQRVSGNKGQDTALHRLVALEAETVHIYRHLQQTPALRDSRLLRRLREESGAFLQILSGMCILDEGDVMVTAPGALRGNPEGLLSLCWRQRRKSLSLLSSGEIPGEFADAAGTLAQQMREHSLMLLELLGRVGRQ